MHLETTSKIDTDSFIQALRRFVCRRGPVREIVSDNGTNFVGTANIFKKEFMEMNNATISNYLASEYCDWITWKRNRPSSQF